MRVEACFYRDWSLNPVISLASSFSIWGGVSLSYSHIRGRGRCLERDASTLAVFSHSVTVSCMPVGICLPFEILIAIAEEVDDAMDLYHLRTASHAWCAAATPFAFRALSVITTKGSAENIGRLFDLPDIAPHIGEPGLFKLSRHICQ
jgi:hypothetical protein